MTSSNGNIFRVTGLLCGAFTSYRWIPRTKASDAELWYFLWSLSEKKRMSRQWWGWWFETPSYPLWRHCNEDMTMDTRPWGRLMGARFISLKGDQLSTLVTVPLSHYIGVIMSAMSSQITGVSIVCSTVCSGADQRKPQSPASLAFVRGIHRWPVNSPHKGPETRKMFPFDDVTMCIIVLYYCTCIHHHDIMYE